jgi:hypothetical protein
VGVSVLFSGVLTMSIKRIKKENETANKKKIKCPMCKKVNGRLGAIGGTSKKVGCLGCLIKHMQTL